MSEFEISKELMERQLSFVKKANETGKVRIGINEVTKAIERDKAKLVLIALDVSPKEIVMHLPLLCKEKKVPYTFVSTRKELGEKAGIEVGTAAAVVIEEGKDGRKELLDIARKLAELGGIAMDEAKLAKEESPERTAQTERHREEHKRDDRGSEKKDWKKGSEEKEKIGQKRGKRKE